MRWRCAVARRRRIWSRPWSTLRCCAPPIRGDVIPVDGDGVVALDALEALLAASGEPALVSVMLANNETGVIQPVAEVAAMRPPARRAGPLRCGTGGGPDRRSTAAGARRRPAVASRRTSWAGPAGVGALVVDAAVSAAARCSAVAARSAAGGPAPRTSSASPASARRPSGRATLRRCRSATLLRDRLERRLRAACPSCTGIRCRRHRGCRTPRALPCRVSRRDPGDRLRSRRRRRQRRLPPARRAGHPQPCAGGDGRWRRSCRHVRSVSAWAGPPARRTWNDLSRSGPAFTPGWRLASALVEGGTATADLRSRVGKVTR